jgi:hypothetical protein
MTNEEAVAIVRKVTLDNEQFAAPKTVFDALEVVLSAAGVAPSPNGTAIPA